MRFFAIVKERRGNEASDRFCDLTQGQRLPRSPQEPLDKCPQDRIVEELQAVSDYALCYPGRQESRVNSVGPCPGIPQESWSAKHLPILQARSVSSDCDLPDAFGHSLRRPGIASNLLQVPGVQFFRDLFI